MNTWLHRERKDEWMWENISESDKKPVSANKNETMSTLPEHQYIE